MVVPIVVTVDSGAGMAGPAGAGMPSLVGPAGDCAEEDGVGG